MKGMLRFLRPGLLGLALMASVPTFAADSSILVSPQPAAPLAERWTWAESSGTGGGQERWVAWSVRRLMGTNQVVGAFFGRSEQRQTLQERIYGKNPDLQLRSGVEGKVWRQIAIVLKVQGELQPRNLQQVELVSLDWPTDLGTLPLVWLGEASEAESLALVKRLYAAAPSDKLREGLVDAVGLHTSETEAVFDFAKEVLQSGVSSRLRVSAVEVLASVNGEAAVPFLVELAGKDASKEVREEAVEAVADIGGDEAGKALQEMVRKGKDLRVRERALESLQETTAPETLAALLTELAEEDTFEELQTEAVRGLAELPGSIALDNLRKLARSHRNAKVREQAIDELVERCTPSEAGALLEQVALQDPSSELQQSAASELEDLNPTVALPIVKRLVAKHPNAEVRSQLLEVIVAQAPAADAAAELERISYDDSSREVRQEAVHRLSDLLGDVSFPVLTRLVREHQEAELREQALETLLQSAPPAQLAPVLASMAFEDPSKEMQEQALDGLSQLPAEFGLKPLLEAAQTHPSIELRQSAIELLRESADPRAKKLVQESDRREEDE